MQITMSRLMILIIAVLMVGILIGLLISYWRYKTGGPKQTPKVEAELKEERLEEEQPAETTPRLAEIDSLLEKKTREIRQEKQDLQQKARQNLRFLQELCEDKEVIGLTKTGTILWVHPDHWIYLRWNPHEGKTKVDGSGFGLGEPAVEGFSLRSLRLLAELNPERVINTIKEQLQTKK